MFHVSDIKMTSVQNFCSQVWWLTLLRGIAVSVLGGFLIARPGLTAVVLVQFLGAYFIVDGGFAIINSVIGRKYGQRWGLGLLMGSLEVLIGIFIFGQPIAGAIVTARVLIYCAAFLAIAAGSLGAFTGIQLLRELNDSVASLRGVSVAMITAGILAIIFGVILMLNPEASAEIYLSVMGVIAVIGGVVQILAALQIRKIGKQGCESTTTEVGS